MVRRDNRPIAISPGNQQVEDLALARGVKRRGWLVQQQDVRIENQYRRKGHPLLFLRRRGDGACGPSNELCPSPPADPKLFFGLIAGPFQLKRAERQFIEDCRVEELHLAILEE